MMLVKYVGRNRPVHDWPLSVEAVRRRRGHEGRVTTGYRIARDFNKEGL